MPHAHAHARWRRSPLLAMSGGSALSYDGSTDADDARKHISRRFPIDIDARHFR